MGSKVAVIVGSGRRGFSTDATDVGFFSRVNLEMIRKIVTPGEFLMAGGTLVVPVSTVFRHMSLPVALHCEL